jgi:hypothetical protein
MRVSIYELQIPPALPIDAKTSGSRDGACQGREAPTEEGSLYTRHRSRRMSWRSAADVRRSPSSSERLRPVETSLSCDFDDTGLTRVERASRTEASAVTNACRRTVCCCRADNAILERFDVAM